MRHKVLFLATLLAVLANGAICGDARAEAAAPKQGTEEEFLIVKYGAVQVKSALPDAKVYIDDVYKGMANALIENVVAGEHTIACALEDKTISGSFTVRKNETLKLEARFNEGKLVNLAEQESAAAKKKKEQEAAKQEQKKKAEMEAKKPEKSPAEERRELHLNVFKIEFKDRNSQEVGVTARANPKVISNYAESKGQTGKYYRTKQGQLLCEAGPCVQEWTTKFFYTDENSRRDAFLITWRQTVFSGITPTGTSNRELTWCLNGTCKKIEDIDTSDAPRTLALGSYVLNWTKASAIFRRADIVKEILDAGGTLPE
jgi:hypothetical protein